MITVYGCGCIQYPEEVSHLDEFCNLARRRVGEAKFAADLAHITPSKKRKEMYGAQKKIAEEWLSEHYATQRRVGKFRNVGERGASVKEITSDEARS